MSAGTDGGSDRGLSGSVWRAASSPPSPKPESRLLTPAVVGSVLVLVLSAATSISWVVAQGGVTLPSRAPAGAVAGASFAPSGTASAALPERAAPSPTPAVGAVTSAPPQATSSPAPVRSAAPARTSDRYALLVACPGAVDCYRYTVRAGDNLWSIARWFGVPLETVYERNPELRVTTLRPGMEIILPTPTR